MSTGKVKVWRLEEKGKNTDSRRESDEPFCLREFSGGLLEGLELERTRIDGKISRCRERKQPFVISLAGAGGKTTVMFQLAEELAQDGWKVAVTTTTHIFMPEKNRTVLILPDNAGKEKEEEDAFRKKLEQAQGILVAGVRCQNKTGKIEKLSALPTPFLSLIEEWADILLIEADGSKRLPIKVPAPWEPVILPETSLVLGCVGLSALGKPWREVCFRSEYGKKFFHGDLVTEEAAVAILADRQGTRKSAGDREYMIILNQADRDEDRTRGEKILVLAAQKKIKGICTSFFL